MTDMRNVNNWVNKDCRSWAKSYFQTELCGLTAEKNTIQVVISGLDSITGDVDLNQRKGKLLAIYDVVVDLSWEGKDLNNGIKVFGKINIPEVAYDTEIDDYVFNISVNSNDDISDQAKKVIRTELVPKLRHKFSLFTNDLVKRHSSDVYADKGDQSTPQSPELVQRKQQQSVPIYNKEDNKSQPVRTTKSHHSFDFKGSDSRDVYEALLDNNRASVWSQGRAKVSKRIGSDFEFFDGNVHGVLLETLPGQKIIQTWRLKSWPKDHYSTVTLQITNTEDGATVNLSQTGIPSGQEDAIKRNWMGYYWKPMEAALNTGIFDTMPIQSDSPLSMPSTSTLIIVITLIIALISATAFAVAPKISY